MTEQVPSKKLAERLRALDFGVRMPPSVIEEAAEFLEGLTHEPPAELRGPELYQKKINECQAIWRTNMTLVCTLPKGHDGDHRADCGYAFNGEVDVRAAQPPSPEWRPIETASAVDGNPCIVAVPNYNNKVIKNPPMLVGEAHAVDGVWYWAGNDPTDAWGGPIDPTHWQPLPSPPTKGANDA